MSKSGVKTEEYLILGVMSGTSLDGLDMALVQFYKESGCWRFELLAAETSLYDAALTHKLKTAIEYNESQLKAFDLAYGRYLGGQVSAFLHGKPRPNFVASHGHTIFHQPEKGITMQVGDGKTISENCHLPVISDFRSADVSLGGQGAPLVPIGDRDLFFNYDFCLNLGGIANVSFQAEGLRRAFDICPVNMALNPLAQKLGNPYDEGGHWARRGKRNPILLDQLNAISYCQKTYPKSLGLEDYRAHWQPLIEQSSANTYDQLNSLTEHAAMQIAQAVNQGKNGQKMLVTGGGAYNDYLVERLRHHCRAEIIIPDSLIVSFKEAIVFAYLGLLRKVNSVNCLASVTGAGHDSSGGKLNGFIKC